MRSMVKVTENLPPIGVVKELLGYQNSQRVLVAKDSTSTGTYYYSRHGATDKWETWGNMPADETGRAECMATPAQ